MFDWMKQILNRLNAQTVPMQIALVGGVVVLLVGLATILVVSIGTSFEPLYYNLDPDDAAEVIQFLKKNALNTSLLTRAGLSRYPARMFTKPA